MPRKAQRSCLCKFSSFPMQMILGPDPPRREVAEPYHCPRGKAASPEAECLLPGCRWERPLGTGFALVQPGGPGWVQQQQASKV